MYKDSEKKGKVVNIQEIVIKKNQKTSPYISTIIMLKRFCRKKAL